MLDVRQSGIGARLWVCASAVVLSFSRLAVCANMPLHAMPT